MAEYKYHHLVPRTYLSSWCFSNNQSVQCDKNLNIVSPINIGNHFGINNEYAIKAGNSLATDEDLQYLFAPLQGINVFYDGNKLVSLNEFNRDYPFSSEWELFYNDGNSVGKTRRNIIKNDIDRLRILEIEQKFNTKYENKWGITKSIIEHNVFSTTSQTIPTVYKGFLFKFLFMLNWRSYVGNDYFNDVINMIDNLLSLSDVDIPEEQRHHINHKNARDEVSHDMLLKLLRDFLNDKGVIYDTAKECIKSFTLTLYRAKDNLEFITSDNPCFSFNPKNKIQMGSSISPKIFAIISKNCKKDKYEIKNCSDREVKEINQIIFNYAFENVISKQPNEFKYLSIM